MAMYRPCEEFGREQPWTHTSIVIWKAWPEPERSGKVPCCPDDQGLPMANHTVGAGTTGTPWLLWHKVKVSLPTAIVQERVSGNHLAFSQGNTSWNAKLMLVMGIYIAPPFPPSKQSRCVSNTPLPLTQGASQRRLPDKIQVIPLNWNFIGTIEKIFFSTKVLSLLYDTRRQKICDLSEIQI